MWPAPGSVLGEGRCAWRWHAPAVLASRVNDEGVWDRGIQKPRRPLGRGQSRDTTVDDYGDKGSKQPVMRFLGLQVTGEVSLEVWLSPALQAAQYAHRLLPRGVGARSWVPCAREFVRTPSSATSQFHRKP